MGLLYPLSLQLALPADYRGDERFREAMRALQECSFTGVELNISRPEGVDSKDLKAFLRGFGLTMTMFATGATAKAEGLSLSAEDRALRERSVRRCAELIDLAARFESGVIFGFMKGGVAADVPAARSRFRQSLAEIAPVALRARVPVLVEATNRYESAVANSLDDTRELIAAHANNSYVRMLPDTFHMNIEERDPFGALRTHASSYDSIHFSDNTRRFPGKGAIDFGRYVSFLRETGYRGGIAVEGVTRDELPQEIRDTARYLAPLLREG